MRQPWVSTVLFCVASVYAFFTHFFELLKILIVDYIIFLYIRSYCPVCIDMMCGVGYSERISSQQCWHCFMCTEESVRLLRMRSDWQDRVKEIFNQDDNQIDFVRESE